MSSIWRKPRYFAVHHSRPNKVPKGSIPAPSVEELQSDSEADNPYVIDHDESEDDAANFSVVQQPIDDHQFFEGEHIGMHWACADYSAGEETRDEEEEKAYQVPMEVEPSPTDHEILFDLTESRMLELLTMSFETGNSLSFFDNMMSTLKKLVKNGFDIQKAPHRLTFMDRLRNKVPGPIPTIVQVPGIPIGVPRFSFLDQIKDLLRSECFSDIKIVVSILIRQHVSSNIYRRKVKV
jgi:hypothetical protein